MGPPDSGSRVTYVGLVARAGQQHQLPDTVSTTPTYLTCCEGMLIISCALSGSIQRPAIAKVCQAAENSAPDINTGGTANLGSHICTSRLQDQQYPTCRNERNLRAQ